MQHQMGVTCRSGQDRSGQVRPSSSDEIRSGHLWPERGKAGRVRSTQKSAKSTCLISASSGQVHKSEQTKPNWVKWDITGKVRVMIRRD